VLLLKRLNFIKNSLDCHSPKETTNSIRIKALKKRDDRLMQIWRKEMEQPSVSDILSKNAGKLRSESQQHISSQATNLISQKESMGNSFAN